MAGVRREIQTLAEDNKIIVATIEDLLQAINKMTDSIASIMVRQRKLEKIVYGCDELDSNDLAPEPSSPLPLPPPPASPPPPPIHSYTIVAILVAIFAYAAFMK